MDSLIGSLAINKFITEDYHMTLSKAIPMLIDFMCVFRCPARFVINSRGRQNLLIICTLDLIALFLSAKNGQLFEKLFSF